MAGSSRVRKQGAGALKLPTHPGKKAQASWAGICKIAGLSLAALGIVYTLTLSILAPMLAPMLGPAGFLGAFLGPSLVIYMVAIIAFCNS